MNDRPPLTRQRLEPAGQRFHRARDADRLRLYLDLAGLDLRQIENVIDEREQVVAGAKNGLGELHLLLVEVARLVVGEQLRQDERGVERRAQLVAHVGEELGLVLIGAGELRRHARARVPCARCSSSRWLSRMLACSSSWELVCSSSACCDSRRTCDSFSTWPCSESSSLATRSSSCCVCSSSDWRWVSSSSSSSRVRSFDERTAMPIDSRVRRRSSRSEGCERTEKPQLDDRLDHCRCRSREQ